jgi:ABC-type Fe3+ transport system permease subunit
MTNWKSVRIGCAAAALALMVAGSVMAFGVTHQNQLTFSRPVALPGVVLPAGSYTFDLASDTADVVVVRNRTKVFYMGFTTQVLRPGWMPSGGLVMIGEAPANEAPPITAWYEIGGTIGHEFRY